MSNHTLKFSDYIVFRANIFNYDTKYFEEYIKEKIKIDFSVYKEKSFTNKDLFLNFSSEKIQDQLNKLNSLIGLIHEDSEDYQNFMPNKEAKLSIQTIVDVLSTSYKLLCENEESIKKGGSNLDLEIKQSKKVVSAVLLSNIVYCLLFIDGIIMGNIDLSAVIELLSKNVGVDFANLLFSLLDDAELSDYSKEIAAHILSSVVVFSSNKEYSVDDFRRLIDWVMNYNISKDKKKDSFVTSNLYIILSNDRGLESFLGKNSKLLSELISIISRNYNINTVYESIFCLCNIANNENYFYVFEKDNGLVLEKLVQVIKLNKVEKIIRIGALCIKVIFY